MGVDGRLRNSLDASSQNKATNGVLCVPPKPSREALVAYLTSNLGGITGLWESARNAVYSE